MSVTNQSSPGPVDANLTVLLVDDDALPRRALVRTLQHDGWNVEAVDGAPAALDALSRQRFQLVISDHMMPDVSGITLLHQVRELYPATVRVITTGSADPREVEAARDAGDVDMVLHKPWSLSDVRDVMAQARRRLVANPGSGNG
jgi:CheY-like chemotaxis protein